MTTRTSSAPGTVRNDRAAITRAAIVAAARSVFVAQGYRATSLRDIATAAGISHPGLLRHFATKDELLATVVAALEDENEAFLMELTAAAEPGALGYAALAERNETIAGYLPLFAALTGEASSPRHPAHQQMRDRYRRIREIGADAVAEAIAHDLVAADRDPIGESIRVAAAWDGLQVLEQYLPARVDVTEALAAHEDAMGFPFGWRDPAQPPPATTAVPIPPMPPLGTDPGAESGYRAGRERRARIVADAMAMFAAEGYGDTSLRDVAERAGVSKSTLLHHYPTKEALLSAVVRGRDAAITARVYESPGERAVDELLALPTGAAENAATAPGLAEVYAVLSCEAVPADHPAHLYFVERFTQTLDHMTALFRAAQADGDLPSHRDPDREALWLVALWDGLQYQWLYDRDSVSVAEHLPAHLADVLPRA